MSVSKVTINGATQMDLTQDTVDAENLMSGETAHMADGSPVTGTHVDGGGGAAGESGALFIDYDGTELYTYTTAQALALTALPANPTHTGLTAQGWNWSLANIKAYLTKYPDAMVVVGQMYITDDGKTRIYIHLEEERKSPMLGLCVNGSVDVDWGDETTHDTLTGSSTSTAVFTQTHNYASDGDYVISLTVTGSATISGENSQLGGSYLLRYNNSTNQSNVYYNSVINKIEIGNNIGSISNYGFYSNCYAIKTITIPSGVTSIGENAFYYCSSLKSITIPKGITAIETSAFSMCRSLVKVSISDTVTSISNNAFYNCYNLEEVTIPDGITIINTYLFYNCALKNITIPDSVTKIMDNSFYYCQSIKKIVVPDGVTEIGTYAFYFNSAVESIEIPNTVLSIGNAAFAACYKLKTINIPNGITSINSSTFSNCRSLESITLPNTITSIGDSAFYSCYKLEEITIPSGVTTIGNSVFTNCYALKTITIPSGVTSMGTNVFQKCVTLKEITMPTSINAIGKETFSGCNNIREITIPNSVTSIGESAFNECYSHIKITIPSGVTTMGKKVFYYNYSLLEIHMLPTTPPSIATDVFANIPSDCKIYVPAGYLEDYKTAFRWSNYSSIMQEEPAT